MGRLLPRQYWPLLLAILLVVLAFIKPTIQLKRDIYNYAFIIDITQSMNARDYHVAGLPPDRLSFAKQAVKQALQKLPCHSTVSIGLFTTKNVFLLFEPLEICKHYAAIEESLLKIDWRMAWAADSHIARGVYTAIRNLRSISPEPVLVFMSDGQQTPSIAKEPGYPAKLGKANGLLVGVGNLQPVPVPRYDKNHIQQGFWQVEDAEVMSNQAREGNFLTAVQENHLRRLAALTGLNYLHLETPEQFTEALLKQQFAQQQPVETDLGWVFAALGLVVFTASYWLRLLFSRS
jgi:mxaL protein